MGLFGGLDKDRYDRQYSDGYLFRRLASYFHNQRRRLLVISGAGLVVSISVALVPVIIAAAIGEVQQDSGTGTLTLLIGALLVAALIQYSGNWVRRRMTNRLVGDLIAKMRKDAFAAAVGRDMAFYDENKTGKVLSRITGDTDDFGQILIISSDVLSQVLEVMVLVVVLLNRNVLLTVLSIVLILPAVGATLAFRKLARAVTRQGSRAMAAVNDNIQESVTGISVAKNFRQEAMIYEEFARVNQQSYRVNLRRGLVLSTVFPVLNALGGLATGGIVYLGAVGVTQGAISVSVWYLFLQSVERFFFPVINLSSFWSQFQQAMSSLERIFALIDAENTVQQTASDPVVDLEGKIEFDDVIFEYTPGVRVLDHFNLTIRPGENVAFVGHTGAGKSTIAKLIMRLYEFQGGSIRIDGRDIRSFDLHAYRSHIGFVPQMPFLFSGTIADNIRYGKPDATNDEIAQIAYSIGNGEWLETLPDGLQSDVGERGARLSMGQRQLVGLLRVLVQKPPVFILDEATASVDNFTEAQIQETLERILAQSTSILIAHRLSTVRSADRIIVLEKAHIIEEGSHDNLIERGGLYADLYNTYFRHQSLSYVEDARALLDEESIGD